MTLFDCAIICSWLRYELQKLYTTAGYFGYMPSFTAGGYKRTCLLPDGLSMFYFSIMWIKYCCDPVLHGLLMFPPSQFSSRQEKSDKVQILHLENIWSQHWPMICLQPENIWSQCPKMSLIIILIFFRM